jgi:acyl-CoA synthetase (AMP-forming)/AMP-acid ligase II/acyl carrier protein
MNPLSSSSETLVDLLRCRARHSGGAPFLRFLTTGEVDGPVERRTFAQAHRAACRIAHQLRRAGLRPGDRAALLYAPSLEFVDAFLGCLVAGVVAVPLPPPDPSRLDRALRPLLHILSDCGASAVLSTTVLAGIAQASVPELGGALGGLPWVCTDTDADGAGVGEDGALEGVVHAAKPDSLAFLQYTSGSTSAPKGVRISHRNLTANGQMISQVMGTHPGALGICWLPLHHDMGLIGNVLHPLSSGCEVVLMSPMAFLERPLRWLEAVSRLRGGISGGPNFAYALATRRVRADPRLAEGLDLSSWHTAYVGAEPVRMSTLAAFTETFAPYGFRKQALLPCYGLAEATLLVSGSHLGARSWDQAEARPAAAGERGAAPVDPVAQSGAAAPGVELAVVELGSTRTVAEGVEGEVVVRSPSVTQGYWGRPRPLLGPVDGRGEGWLRTGDLGFLRGGQLYTTGRLKDLIVVRGRNLHPQDIEQVVEALPGVRPGCVAAFPHVASSGAAGPSGAGGATREEGVGIALELRRPRGGAPHSDTQHSNTQHSDTQHSNTVAEVLAAVTRATGVRPVAVFLLSPRTICKTTSGKIQRRATRTALAAGELVPLHTWTAAPPAADPTEAPVLVAATRWLARHAGVAPDQLDASSRLDAHGVDSVTRAELLAHLRTELGVELDHERVFAAQSLAELAAAGPPVPPPLVRPSSLPPRSPGPVVLPRLGWGANRFGGSAK